MKRGRNRSARPPLVNANIPKGAQMARSLARLGAALVLVAGLLLGIPGTSQAATAGPCDIYASAGTPCVAAHSTTRALLGSYNGSLYQVKRASDGATRNIGLLTAGGYANAASQDSFCVNTTCVITIIYDQTSRHNDLTPAPPGGVGGQDNPAPADPPGGGGGPAHPVAGRRAAGDGRRPQRLRRLDLPGHGLPRQLDLGHR